MKRVGPRVRRRRALSDLHQAAETVESAAAAKLDLPLADIGLNVRTVNTLEAFDITTVGQLASKTREELLEIPNFGEQTIIECRKQLKLLGDIPTPNWNKPQRKRRPRKKT